MEKTNKDIITNKFNSKGKWALVVGDVMLDKYIFGEINRISPEAPVPVVEKKSESFRMGGAANVAANLIGLGITSRFSVKDQYKYFNSFSVFDNNLNLVNCKVKDDFFPTLNFRRLRKDKGRQGMVVL